MCDIYSNIPETNLVSRVYSVAPIPQSQFIAHLLLFPYVKCFALLLLHFPQYVCGAQCSFFLYFLDLVLPRYVA